MSRRAILVADDSCDDIEILQYAFSKAGIDVPIIGVSDGQEAINYLSSQDRELHPLPCLLVLDLKMPMVDGFDVLRWLKESALKLLPVAVLTSSDAEKDVERAYELGANSYLVKPSKSEEYQTLVLGLRDYWLRLNRPPALAQ